MSIDLAYAELGLSPGASESEVRAAWRRLVSRWHPDRNSSAEAVDLIQRINSAYEKIKRAAFTGGRPQEHPPAPTGAAPEAAAKGEAQGRVVRRKVRLSLEEAVLGCTRVFRGKFTHVCASCTGDGVLEAEMRCPGCEGTGNVRTGAWFGWVAMHNPCKMCQGRGRVPQACSACQGQGKRFAAYRRSVRIPAGVRKGDVLSAPGARDRDDGFDGTLELHVDIVAHKLFTVGDDGCLRCEMPVDGFAWIANAWVEVPTLTGLQQMRLQRGRQVYRLRGQGLPLERQGQARGDYLVTVVPTFPDAPTAQQQALLEQLAASTAVAAQGDSGPIGEWRLKVRAWDRSRT